jgi:hypothetical protein
MLIRNNAALPRVSETEKYYYDDEEEVREVQKKQRSYEDIFALFLLKLKIKRRYYCLLFLIFLIVFPLLISEAFYDHIIYTSVILYHRARNGYQDMPWHNIPVYSEYRTFSMADKYKSQSVVLRGQESYCTINDELPLLVNMRVPRSAGTTVTDLLHELSRSNHFIVSLSSRLKAANKQEVDRREQDMISYLDSFQHKLASSSHLRFMDFKKYGEPEPLYIGTFRDPIERMQSHYNYDSFADRPLYVAYKLWVKREISVVKPTLVQCVRKFIAMNISAADIPYGTNGRVSSLRVRAALKKIPKKYGCLKQKYLNVQLKYYCGYHRSCKSLETVDEMLGIATSNLAKFQVVMLTKDMHTSVHLLEKMMPTYFRGSTHLYENYEKSRHEVAREEETYRNRIRTASPYACNSHVEGTDQQYCACNGTVYYGRKFAEGNRVSSLPMTLDDVRVSGDFVSADTSKTGGMHCTHEVPISKGGFAHDPAPKAQKQCICEPQAPHDSREMQINKLFHMRGSVNTRTPSRIDLMPDDVKDYLRSFLKNEIALYEEVQKHFQNNVKRCGV